VTHCTPSNYHGSACLNASGGLIPGRQPASAFDCIQSPLSAITAANTGGGSTSGASVIDGVKGQLGPANKYD
jgi:hypothetical protein